MRFRVECPRFQLLHRERLRFFCVDGSLIVLSGIQRTSCEPGICIQVFRISSPLAAIGSKLRFSSGKVVLCQQVSNVVDNPGPCDARREKNADEKKAKTHFPYDDAFEERWQISGFQIADLRLQIKKVLSQVPDSRLLDLIGNLKI
jgi:hypothetical protein